MTWIHDLSARKRKKLYTNSSPLLPLAHATRILLDCKSRGGTGIGDFGSRHNKEEDCEL